MPYSKACNYKAVYRPRLLSSRVNRYTKEQNTAKQMIVSHHGLKGIGNKTTSNHKRHQLFREGVVSPPPVFAGISIVEFTCSLEELMGGFRSAVYHHVPGKWGNRPSGFGGFHIDGKAVYQDLATLLLYLR